MRHSVYLNRRIAADLALSSGELLSLSFRLEKLWLAIIQAAAFIQESVTTVSEYLGRLEKSDHRMYLAKNSRRSGEISRLLTR